MEIEQGKAINDVDHHEMLKEHQVAFSSVNAAQTSPSPSRKNGKPVSKPSQDGHDCKKSKQCNEKWGGLGCVKIYQLATVKKKERSLKETEVGLLLWITLLPSSLEECWK